jgi:acyl transferase domain-containing protein
VSLESEISDHEIAIIGMAGRFPGARDIDELWQVVHSGSETITFFSDDELLAAGVPAATLHDPRYVKAQGRLAQVEDFDASFFGYSPREAEILDPQHRLFLEEAWHALEHAGYDPQTYRGRIGVYGGSKLSHYLLYHLLTRPELWQTMGNMQIIISNDKDTLASRVSYKLNLRGPAINVQTACSTSLVAVHLACQSLLCGENDIALAGGCAIVLPQEQGYFYQEGGVASADGHCRAFDARASGTVSASGVGLVVLKRLANALADGDTIHAVIKGSAINNDGSLKVGFTAPGIEGQAEVIADALAMAEVQAEQVAYIETHGTGTTIGDPIEVAALTRVFRAYTERTRFCALGSLKTNMGHLDSAAGVAGLIKTVLALKHGELPPHLHFAQPNPAIDFARSPFYVNTHLSPWPAQDGPRLAGVSSFGIGGTNAHVIVAQAPPPAASAPSRPWQILPLSARTASALEQRIVDLRAFLCEHPDCNLADLAYTCQVGRSLGQHRLVCVCQDTTEAAALLHNRPPERVFARVEERQNRQVALLFSGQGAQYVGMGRELYDYEPVFQAQIDRCARLLQPLLDLDIRELLYPPAPQEQEQADRLVRMRFAQPVVFSVEYALAQCWLEAGLLPRALLGHSLGEYVAACLAGVFSLEDALTLVTARGHLMERAAPGAMLSVVLAESDLLTQLPDRLDLAAVNGPQLCTVAGPADEVAAWQARLASQGVETRLLPIPAASHSALMEPVLADFLAVVQGVRLHEPRLPLLSNVTGTWMTAGEATDPAYWTRHLRQTVRFADGLAELLQEPDLALVEVGPGRTLSTLARQMQPQLPILPTLVHAREADTLSSQRLLLETLARLWLVGVPLDWSRVSAREQRRRIPLPLYPFERQRYWIEARPVPVTPAGQQEVPLAETGQQKDETPQAAVALQPHNRPHLLTAYLAPQSAVERSIAATWEEILGTRPIGLHDNFFELGGHSLLLTRITARLSDLFPVEFPLRRLVQAETIAQMAAVVETLLIEKIEELSEEEVERFL